MRIVSKVVSPTVTTTYSVTGTDVNNFKHTAVITQVVEKCATGIATQHDQGLFMIYPNPAHNSINIEREVSEPFRHSLMNSLGSEIGHGEMRDQKINLDLNNYPDGIYLVVLQKELGTQTFKFLKH